MGKGKKGSGKAVSRNMENFNNHRAWLKDTGRMVAVLDMTGVYSYTNLEMVCAKNYSDYVSNRIDYPLAVILSMSSFPISTDFVGKFIDYVEGSLLKLGVFSEIRPIWPSLSCYPNLYCHTRSRIVDCFNKFYPGLYKDAFELYTKALCILFEYEPELMTSKIAESSNNPRWFLSIYDMCVLLCINDMAMKKGLEGICDNSIKMDYIFTYFKDLSAEEEAERVKTYSGRLICPAFYSKKPCGLSVSQLSDFKNDMFKSYLCNQVSLTIDSFTSGNKKSYVDAESKMIRVISRSDGSYYHYLSYEYLRESGDFPDYNGADETFIEIARMDLGSSVDGDISVLKDKSYYSDLQYSLCLVNGDAEKYNIANLIRDSLTQSRVGVFVISLENSLSSQCQSYEGEIRSLKSEVKSEKREREKVEKGLQAANDTIADMNSRESVILKDNEVVVSKDVISKYDSTISDLEKKVAELTNSLSKASGKCEWQEKQIAQLEEVVASYDNYDKELLELRGENIYLSSIIEKMEDLNKEDEDVKQKRFEEQLSAIKDIPILFVGGIGDMMSKFKDIFPNSDYIDVSDEGVNFSVPPRFQYVVLYTRSITHPHCYRVESQVPRERIIFMSMSNTELVVDELYKRIVNGGYSEV